MPLPRKYRILFDLTPALHTQAGIPKTTRQLFELLASCPDLEITGLIHGHSNASFLHRFYQGPERHRSLSNQAEFLHHALHESEPEKFGKWERKKRGLWNRWRSWTRVRFSLHPLDASWKDAIWRNYLAPSLEPSARECLDRVSFVGANLTLNLLRQRLKRKQCWPLLDTTGFDTLILQKPLPIRVSAGTRKMSRCHDLVPLLYFDTQPHSVQGIRFAERSIQGSLPGDFLVSVSQATQSDIQNTFPGLQTNWKVIPHFLPPPPTLSPSPASLDSILRQHADSNREGEAVLTGEKLAADGYFIAVSTLEPRKNWLTLLRAFSLLRPQHSFRLVVVGATGWKYKPILEALRPLVETGRVIHLSGVDSMDLNTLYRHAQALVYPSFQEGFGLPPLEAAANGTPSILSDIPAHREVMQNGAVYCDPYSVASVVRAMETMLETGPDAEVRRQKILAEARERLATHTREKILKQWLGLLESKA